VDAHRSPRLEKVKADISVKRIIAKLAGPTPVPDDIPPAMVRTPIPRIFFVKDAPAPSIPVVASPPRRRIATASAGDPCDTEDGKGGRMGMVPEGWILVFVL
jgi:hypothetical protein